MSSTNHTTNYNLPQFVGSDKPAWLGDINPAFSAIDTAMKANETSASLAGTDATTAKNNIGTMADLTTTERTTLVGAINEVKSTAGTAQGTADGAVASLSQTNTKLNDFITGMTINDFETCEKTLSGTSTKLRLTLAQSADGSIFKFYGVCQISNASGSTINPFGAIRNANGHIKTGLYLNATPDSAFSILPAGMVFTKGSTAIANNSEITAYVEADGEITFDYWGSGSISNGQSHYLYLPPCVYFNTNFGDTPTNA